MPDPDEPLKEIKTALDALDAFVWKIEEQENKNVKPPLTVGFQPVFEPLPDKLRETRTIKKWQRGLQVVFYSVVLVVVCFMLGYLYGRDNGRRIGITYVIEAVRSCQASLQKISGEK